MSPHTIFWFCWFALCNKIFCFKYNFNRNPDINIDNIEYDGKNYDVNKHVKINYYDAESDKNITLKNGKDFKIVGYVRDFISFKFGSYYFPIFNIADMAICIGALLLIISTIKEELNKDGNKSRRSKGKKTR